MISCLGSYLQDSLISHLHPHRTRYGFFTRQCIVSSKFYKFKKTYENYKLYSKYLFLIATPVTMYDHVIYCSNTSDSSVDAILLYKGERPTRNINAYAICRYITYVPPTTSGVDVCEIEIGGKCAIYYSLFDFLLHS